MCSCPYHNFICDNSIHYESISLTPGFLRSGIDHLEQLSSEPTRVTKHYIGLMSINWGYKLAERSPIAGRNEGVRYDLGFNWQLLISNNTIASNIEF